jgi:hypothetical protein
VSRRNGAGDDVQPDENFVGVEYICVGLTGSHDPVKSGRFRMYVDPAGAVQGDLVPLPRWDGRQATTDKDGAWLAQRKGNRDGFLKVVLQCASCPLDVVHSMEWVARHLRAHAAEHAENPRLPRVMRYTLRAMDC